MTTMTVGTWERNAAEVHEELQRNIGRSYQTDGELENSVVKRRKRAVSVLKPIDAPWIRRLELVCAVR